jgi:DNA-binding NtrC family response regulator
LEVDQLPAEAQAVLAGMLNISEFGLRTLATTSDPLLQLAGAGRFRLDLAFALSTLAIELPPLSARIDDLPLLAQSLLEDGNLDGERQLSGFEPAALDALRAFSWPGNIEELAEVVQSAAQCAAGPRVAFADLPETIRHWSQAATHPPRREERIVLDEFLQEIEKELLVRALAQAKGNKAKAARLLGVTRARVLRRADHFGL